MKPWIESIATILVSVTTLVVTVFIAYQQWRLKKREIELDERRYKREQYEKRLAIYERVATFLTQTSYARSIHHNIDYEDFLRNTAESHFLFAPEIPEFINEIYKKARELDQEIGNYEAGQGPVFDEEGELVQEPLSQAELKATQKEIKALNGWFRNQKPVALTKFKQYLQV